MAASAGSQIPVVDFSVMSLENAAPLTENNQAVKIVAEQLYRAFSTIGFVYLQNHGIPQEMVRYYPFGVIWIWIYNRGQKSLGHLRNLTNCMCFTTEV